MKIKAMTLLLLLGSTLIWVAHGSGIGDGTAIGNGIAISNSASRSGGNGTQNGTNGGKNVVPDNNGHNKDINNDKKSENGNNIIQGRRAETNQISGSHFTNNIANSGGSTNAPKNHLKTNPNPPDPVAPNPISPIKPGSAK
jgi:hypothetical protein